MPGTPVAFSRGRVARCGVSKGNVNHYTLREVSMYKSIRTISRTATLCCAVWAAAGFTEDVIPASLTLIPPVSTANTAQSTVAFDLALISGRIGELRGVSLALISSKTLGAMNGYQAAAITTIADGPAVGYQTTGIVNIAKDDMSGMQAAGVVNIARKRMFGLQSGFVNIAQDMTGVQVGFVNIAHTLKGVPVGIINITDDGKKSAIAFGTNFSGVNAGAKFIVNNFHSIIALGSVDIEDDYNQSIAFSTFWGYHQPLGPLYAEIDYGTMYLAETEDFDSEDVRAKTLNTIRLGLGWDITPWLSVFGGVGPGVEVLEEDWDNAEFKLLAFGGVTLF